MSLNCPTKLASVVHQVMCLNSFELTYLEWMVEINTHWSFQSEDGMFHYVDLLPSMLEGDEDGYILGANGNHIPKNWADARSVMMSDPSDVAAYLAGVQAFNPTSVPTVIRPLVQGYFLEAIGCLDPTAENFDIDANTDSGDCYYIGDGGVELGCKNENAENYNPDTNVGACEDCCVMEYVGCTNATALNFDPVATEACVNCCEFATDTPPTTTTTSSVVEAWYENTTNQMMIGGGVVVLGLVYWAFRK